MSNTCVNYNIIWPERGIILTIIEHITENYKKLLNKTIIIENEKYRNFIALLFPELIFKNSTHKSNKNFYFNIRKIIKKQDVIIDYLNNYQTIKGSDINVLPYFDPDDIIVKFVVSKNNIYQHELLNLVNNMNRCNFRNTGHIWDIIREKAILSKYNKYINNNITVKHFISILNKYFKKTLLKNNSTQIIPLPFIQYVYLKDPNSTKNTKNVSKDEVINFINIIDKKIDQIKNLTNL